MAYGDFKNLSRRKLLIKYYVIKHLILLKIQKMMDINVVLHQWSINFLIKKTSGGGATLANKSAIKNKIVSNKELAEELHIPIIKKFNKRKIHSTVINNIWVQI